MGQLKNLKEDVGHLRSLVIRLQIMDSPDEKDRVLVGEFPPRYESPIAKFVHCWPLCSNHNILILPPPLGMSSTSRVFHVCDRRSVPAFAHPFRPVRFVFVREHIHSPQTSSTSVDIVEELDVCM